MLAVDLLSGTTTMDVAALQLILVVRFSQPLRCRYKYLGC